MPSSSPPAETSSPPPDLLAAAYALAAAQMSDGDDDGREKALQAVAALRAAPPLDHWNASLLGGLRSRDPEVVEATVRATLDRLASLRDPESEDRFVAAILDACFLNLSGRPRRPGRSEADLEATRRSDQLEQVSAQLLQALARLLSERPAELDHHRARLVARARQLAHLPGRGYLAQAIVAFLRGLRDAGRSDGQVVAELARRRQFELFASPLTSEATLCAHLEEDRRLCLADISGEHLRAYRLLLAAQSKERARGAILDAMSNLIAWLDESPQGGPEREQVLGEVLSRARVGVPWQELDVRVCRHLEAHLELLPGRENADDLLRLLAERYDSAEGEDVLIRGLAVLERLPLVRLRSEELCAFVLRPGGRHRSGAAWQALLSLVEALVTGLPDFVLTREGTTPREQRRQRLLQDVLAHDARLRALLHRLATDTGLPVSEDREVEARVRESAWRILLRSLPEDRTELLREGLLGHQGRLYFATLAEAAQGRQRDWWALLAPRWQEVVDAAPNRQQRIAAALAAFRSTLNYDAVQDDGRELGLFVELALDDADPAVRQEAEAALVDAGYAGEVARERQKRELLRLRDGLTASNRKVIELEGKIARLAQTTHHTQLAKAERSLEVQEQLQQRDLLITEGWLATAELQVDLQEVRDLLTLALARAQHELELLHELGRRMAAEQDRCREVQQAIASLVREQEGYEREIHDLESEQNRLSHALDRARGEISSLESRRRSLAANPPARPSRARDPEQARIERERYEQRRARHESEVQHVGQGIDAAQAEVARTRKAIESCRQRISRAEAEVRRLQSEIDRHRQRIAELHRQLDRLTAELAARQATCEAIRREIAQLRSRLRAIEGRLASQRRELHGELAASHGQIVEAQQALAALQESLQDLSTRLNQRGDQRDRETTDGTRLRQAIESGRDQHERIGEEARQQSAVADATGRSLQEAHEQDQRARQESLVHYTEGLAHALEHRSAGRRPKTRKDTASPTAAQPERS